jgi:hypothetical protein
MSGVPFKVAAVRLAGGPPVVVARRRLTSSLEISPLDQSPYEFGHSLPPL